MKFEMLLLSSFFCVGLLLPSGTYAQSAVVDFTKETGRIRPALHSSGWAPRICPRAIQNDDEVIRSMNLTYARTHDWPLVSTGQRIVDTHFIFPLQHLDPKDPKNYYFAPTDECIRLAKNVGLKIFYRLGTSIEHSKDIHFNASVPQDFEKSAEVFAGTVRHYNQGWANGHKWNIEYWEIWNEPDGTGNMWCEKGKSQEELRDKFIKFFVTVLKRLKSEFPQIKVGGPALCSFKPEYFRPLLQACKDAGVAPDFISWHFYGNNPALMIGKADAARKLCDSFGFTKTELILNEWHYLLTWDGIHGRNSTPAMVKRALNGPSGHNQIDSACFTLSSLIGFQTSKLDQAYYYGCSHKGNWGYMDEYKQFNKVYYAIKIFGSLVKDYSGLYQSASRNATVSVMATKSPDGSKAAILLSDYRGKGQTLTVDVKGMEHAKKVSAIMLDHTHDNNQVDVRWNDGRLTLSKPDTNSAAFLVTFQ